MRFGPAREIANLPGTVKLSQQWVRMARQLVEAMSGPWTPSDYRDTYTDRVNEVIEAKRNEEEFEPAAGPPSATNVTDLRAVLQASVDAAGKAGQGKPTGQNKSAKSSGGPKTRAKSQSGKTDGKKTPAKKDATARQQHRTPAA